MGSNWRWMRLACGLALLCCLAIPLHGFAQGGMLIGTGARVVCTGSPSIVVDNGKWENNGTFTASSSLVRIQGTASTANSTIGGSSSTTFFDLTQQKAANSILLMQNIGVTRNFTMNGGLFELNNFIVTLGTAQGQIVSETETNRITGITGGEIVKVMTLNAPAAINPGNLGAEFTSAANLGVTEIRRGHVQQQDGGTGISIFRYYDITPTNNAGLNATLRQRYFDAELGTLVEAQLEHFSSLDGGATWYYRGQTLRNTALNFVDNGIYGDLRSRWTLASASVNPLSVEFLSEGIRCRDDVATLFWTVMEQGDSDHFQVMQSDDQLSWQAAQNGWVASQGLGQQHYEFQLNSSAQYFKVQHFDRSGSSSFSESVKLNCSPDADWLIWPNPVAAQLHVLPPFGEEILSYQITDLMGKVVLAENFVANAIPELVLDLQNRLPAAVYHLNAKSSQGRVLSRKIEVLRN